MDSIDVEELARSLVAHTFAKIDIRKVLSNGQILVEFNEENLSISGFDDDERVETIVFDGTDDKLSTLCKFLGAISHYTRWRPSKHSEVQLCCGLDDYTDEAREKILNIISEDQFEKLQEEGFSVVREVY